MKLKHKISISMTLVSFSLLILTSYIYSEISYKSIMEHEERQLLLSVKEASASVEAELIAQLSNVRTMASAPIVTEHLKKSNLECKVNIGESLNEHIAELNKKWINAYNEEDEFVKPYINNPLAKYLKKEQAIFDNLYGEIFITNSHGAIIATTGKLSTLAHSYKYWWKASFADGEGEIFFDDRGFDASANDYVIGIVVPIKENGKLIGIIKANVKILSSLSKIVRSVNSLSRAKLKIVRSKGDIVYEEFLPPLSTSINPTIVPNLFYRDTGIKIVKEFGRDYLAAYSPISVSLDTHKITFGGKATTGDSVKGNDGEIWHSVITYDKELALQESRETNMIIIYIGLLFTVVTWILASYIGRWISKPIEELHTAQSELKKQEEIMVAQSRHAAMGEMISMIAHQWRQPISVIAMGANNIIADIELETLQENKLREYTTDILSKTQELSKTIDDFKNFFRPEKEFSKVLVEDVFDDVFSVVGQSLKNDGIEVIKEFNNATQIDTYPRELMQVLINIIKNAKEAIVSNNSQEKKIAISLYETQSEIRIKICDSGGGIKDEILSEIFNPYFSTKSQNVGTGLGLYMSKTIIEKHLNGIITVYNYRHGACFEIRLPLDLQNIGEIDE